MATYNSINSTYLSDYYRGVNESILAAHNGSEYVKNQAWVDFDRFYTIDPSKEMPSGRHYIFICRPDLYLLQESYKTISLSTESMVNVDPFFNYLAEYHPTIISSLTGDFSGMSRPTLRATDFASGKEAGSLSGHGNATNSDGTTVTLTNGSTIQLPNHAFLPYLTSRVESSQLPDYTIKQNNIVQPFTLYSMPYTSHAIESTTGGAFNITFREDNELSLHKLFYGWIYYQDGVMRNKFKPKDKYIKYRAYDYATSIYDFMVDHTGENIIYWSKYTGCVPTSVSLSNLSFNKGTDAETQLSIPFAYFYHEHMNLEILTDFQTNSLGTYSVANYFSNNLLNTGLATEPIVNSQGFGTGPSFVGRPIIEMYRDGENAPQLKLRWLR